MSRFSRLYDQASELARSLGATSVCAEMVERRGKLVCRARAVFSAGPSVVVEHSDHEEAMRRLVAGLRANSAPAPQLDLFAKEQT